MMFAKHNHTDGNHVMVATAKLATLYSLFGQIGKDKIGQNTVLCNNE